MAQGGFVSYKCAMMLIGQYLLHCAATSLGEITQALHDTRRTCLCLCTGILHCQRPRGIQHAACILPFRASTQRHLKKADSMPVQLYTGHGTLLPQEEKGCCRYACS
jgi:hypothetical protein